MMPGGGALLLAAILAIGTHGQGALSGQPDSLFQDMGAGKYCTSTAKAARQACRNEVEDDYWIAIGNCNNLSDALDQYECLDQAALDREEGRELCGEQYEARLDVCDLVGEARHDPDFDPADFVDPDDIGGLVDPNPFFPLVPGTRWVLQGGEETITVTVLAETKLIEGVTCRVVNDVVEEDGAVIEDTDDWYAQDLAGNVWYCGEIAMDFESFEGDDPEEPELVSIDGSFKAGRDFAKPGTLVLADPQVGDAYRQEFALGEAEDAAEVISVTGTESVPAAACSESCLVTRDFTPLDPGVEEMKYYAPGVGLILEVDDEGNRTELVDFTTP
jgi:hypothetical protein